MYDVCISLDGFDLAIPIGRFKFVSLRGMLFILSFSIVDDCKFNLTIVFPFLQSVFIKSFHLDCRQRDDELVCMLRCVRCVFIVYCSCCVSSRFITLHLKRVSISSHCVPSFLRYPIHLELLLSFPVISCARWLSTCKHKAPLLVAGGNGKSSRLLESCQSCVFAAIFTTADEGDAYPSENYGTCSYNK